MTREERHTGAGWLGPLRNWPARSHLSLFVMLAPALLLLVAFRLAPFAVAALGSLQHVRFGTVTRGFVGFENYVSLLQSQDFLHSLGVTLLFSVIVNPLQILVSLALAILLVQAIPGAGFLRILIFAPVAVPIVVVALVWGIAMRPNDGVLNSVLAAIGVGSQRFLTSSDQALPSVVLLVSWASIGYWTVFLIAGLRDISPTYAEAASVDGAGWWRTLRSVTLPLMVRPIAFVLVADTVANFLLFTPIQILTRGGPQGSTDVLMFDIYTHAYTYDDPNRALPEMVFLMLLVLAVLIVQFRVLRRM